MHFCVPGLFPVGLRDFGGRVAGHEADDVVKLAVTLDRAENVAQRLLIGLGNLEAEFLFEEILGLGADAVLELGAQEFTDGGRKTPSPARCSCATP